MLVRRRWLPCLLFPLTALLFVLVAPDTAHAQTPAPAITFTGGDVGFNGTSGATYGFAFTANTTFNVTSLGIYDANLNGLAQSHAVGIFNSAGNLVVSATVPSGTTAPLINQFRYVTVAPTRLSSGSTYTIGAFYIASGGEGIVSDNAQNFDANDAITYIGGRNSFGSGNTSSLSNPTKPAQSGSTTSYLGPNFLITPVTGAALPEPASLALLALGALPLAGQTKIPLKLSCKRLASGRRCVVGRLD